MRRPSRRRPYARSVEVCTCVYDSFLLYYYMLDLTRSNITQVCVSVRDMEETVSRLEWEVCPRGRCKVKKFSAQNF